MMCHSQKLTKLIAKISHLTDSRQVGIENRVLSESRKSLAAPKPRAVCEKIISPKINLAHAQTRLEIVTATA